MAFKEATKLIADKSNSSRGESVPSQFVPNTRMLQTLSTALNFTSVQHY